MATGEIKVVIDWAEINEGIRKALAEGDLAQLWEDYCYENNIPSDIKIGFMNFCKEKWTDFTEDELD